MNGLAKGCGTLFKSGGPSQGRSSTSSSWKRASLDSKLDLESGVCLSFEDECITTTTVHPHSQSCHFGSRWVVCKHEEKESGHLQRVLSGFD